MRESPLIVLHLASVQRCCMMIKCAFTQKSSETLKLFLKNRKCYQTLYTIESSDNDQLFLPLDRRLYKETNRQVRGRDTDLKQKCNTQGWSLHQVHSTPLFSAISCLFLWPLQRSRYLLEFSIKPNLGLEKVGSCGAFVLLSTLFKTRQALGWTPEEISTELKSSGAK